jgi:hypothetical protein
MDDGDLLISVELDRGLNIIGSYDRYELKSVRQIAVRGYDRYGRRDTSVGKTIPSGPTGTPDGGFRGQPYTESRSATGNSFILNQISVQNRMPVEHPAYQVEIDR